MDNRTRYARITKMLKGIEKKTLKKGELERHIMIEIGSSERTISDAIKLMLDLDMVKEVDHLVFQILE